MSEITQKTVKAKKNNKNDNHYQLLPKPIAICTTFS